MSPDGTFQLSNTFYVRFVSWILRLLNYMIELTDFMMQYFSQGVILSMLFIYILIQFYINYISIISKVDLSTKESN